MLANQLKPNRKQYMKQPYFKTYFETLKRNLPHQEAFISFIIVLDLISRAIAYAASCQWPTNLRVQPGRN